MHDKNIGRSNTYHLLEKGVEEGVFPGAVLLAARNGRICLFNRTGYRALFPEPVPMEDDTIFDLASLTKPLATGLAFMKLVGEGRVTLDSPLSQLLTGIRLNDKKELTVRQILCHCAGFPDWRPFYLELEKFMPERRKEILRSLIIDDPLVYKPGKKYIYSDIGFMVLEWIIEKVTGKVMSSYIDHTFYRPLSLKKTFLMDENSSQRFKKELFASTEECQWRGRILTGEVHDENAFILGGYSGHAGLFGTAKELFKIVLLLRDHFLGIRSDFFRQEVVKEFFTKKNIGKGDRGAICWDTPSQENSSSGRLFSNQSIGHLGFTGTSIWWDLEKDIFILLLTNRIHPTRNNQKIKAFRPMIHDAVMEELICQ